MKVVIAAFRSLAEAHQARAALEACSIGADVNPRDEVLERRCADVFDDGFDVVVDGDDADQAIALLQPMWTEVPTVADVPERCPVCGSPSVAAIPRLWIFAIAAILLYSVGILVGQQELFLLVIAILAFVVLIAPNRRCRDCGERWAAPDPR